MPHLVAPLQDLFDQYATDAEQTWLRSRLALAPAALLTAFVAAPRFLHKTELGTAPAPLLTELPGLPAWTLDRLGRTLLLLHLPADDADRLADWIGTLISTGEVNELVAIYGALPLLPYPERWRFQATEGVRSNMAPVFDAIALDNPYPARYLDETGWNQLVLKSIFNEKPLDRIVGFDERANQRLANTLSDFAHERWAAGRTVPPYAWRLTKRFLTDALRADLRHLLQSGRPEDREAAAFVLGPSES
jgi:hypothetical protein